MLPRCHSALGTLAMSVVLAVPSTASCADLTIQQSLEMLDGALQAVISFDLRVNSEARFLLKSEARKKDPSDPKPTLIITRRLLPHEKPGLMSQSYRQVFQRGKGRIEFLGKDGKSVTNIMIFDDEMMKAVNHDSKTAMIRELPSQNGLVGADYLNTFRNVYGPFPLLTSLRQRRNVVLKDMDNASVILETEPDPKAKIEYPRWGFRVALDRQHGLLPSVIERFEIINGKRLTISKMRVEKWKSLLGGVSVPLVAVTQYFDGNPDGETFGELGCEMRLTVDEARSSWNQEIPASTFEVQIPPGYDVIDRLRQVQYVTGTPDTGKNLEGLAANARKVVPYPVQRPPAPTTSAWRSYAAAGGLAAVAGAAAWLALAYARRKRTGRVP